MAVSTDFSLCQCDVEKSFLKKQAQVEPAFIRMFGGASSMNRQSFSIVSPKSKVDLPGPV